MRHLITLVESFLDDDGGEYVANDIDSRIERVIDKCHEYAESLGVELDLNPHDDNVMLGIWRNDAEPGSGAKVMQFVCDCADREKVEVVLDVHEGNPRLVQYYWQFGFRVSGNKRTEMIEFRRAQKEWKARVASGEDHEGYEIFMFRKPGAKPFV